MKHLLLLTAAAALAACGGNGSDDAKTSGGAGSAVTETETTAETAAATGEVMLTNATAEEVAKQTSAANARNPMQPGEWEQTMEIISVEMPGVPDGPEKQMVQSMFPPGKRTMKQCVTEEEASRGNLDNLTGEGRDCVYEKLRIGGGTLEARFSCTTAQGGKVTGIVEGTNKPTEMDLTLTTHAEVPSQEGAMDIKMRVSGRRLGECPN